ncbi:hypothetical protein Acsp03_26210 [Actinomadura sp. NBRC 104412]|uniref:DUF4132 domain-containing protein n=1 Tax=Actinomadura sp. NBRC 104412 TaxID=3032203 RepID=UPI0024A47D0D|nr:DUF4132 domain-containing protein [Actinomadura sp. NBRC 104412]GLZ05155.1 hypothetical protein Acsp03_26210 [Actinomadura sp. NBRC 104412]
MNEDTLVIPEAWHRSIHPRRGGVALVPAKVAKGSVKKAQGYVEQCQDYLDELTGEVGDAGLAVQARLYLEGQADPQGAAVVAHIAAARQGSANHATVLKVFLDAWMIEHGAAFTACAVVELGSIRAVHGTRSVDKRKQGAVRREYALGSTAARACARRMRALLAAADDAEYEQAVERLAALRDEKYRRLIVSYLVPTRHDWVAECCVEAGGRRPYGDGNPRVLLFQSLGTADHVTALGGDGVLWWSECTAEVVTTLVDGLGEDVLPILTESLDNSYLDSADRQRILDAISVLPTDEAFQALLDRLGQKHVQPALLAMANRYPVRATRMLANAVPKLQAKGDAKAAGRVKDLLAGHMLTHADAADAARPGLTEEGQAVVAALAAATVRVPEAPAEALPSLLAEPPWTRPRKAEKPVVIAGLPVPDGADMVWAEGEQDAWAVPALPPRGRVPADTDWKALAEEFRQGGLLGYQESHLMAQGPEDVVRPLLSAWGGPGYCDVDDVPYLMSIVGRYGLDALPVALKAARNNPGSCAKLLLPYLNAQVAAQMAAWYERVKTARNAALAWFDRHGTGAARMLIPAALGKAGKVRRQAEGALVLIASRTGREPIVEAAREHGDRAAEVIGAMLATDPLDRLPARMPEATEWADPARLPQVLLRGDERALPITATRHLITMLAMSKPGEVYAGLDVVKETCDPDSLAAFSWEVFEEWQRNGAPSKDRWALHQLAWFGDDETVRRLTPVIRAWPGEDGHQKAVTGLDVLAEIGTDVALLHLHGIAQKVKFKGLRTRAQEKIAEVAMRLGLSPVRLADRLVPDFGLDADGSMTLDYGPRRFTVGFDEQLKPYVTDEDGKRRKALPKPGAKDDQELAPAAYKRFANLKKDVRTVAADQVARLESAMVARRRWTPEEFRTLFVEHPLIWHIARRLVWLAEDGGGAALPFRLAEDRTLADVDDDAFTLPDKASIGIAHPLDLGDEGTAAWSEVFADYEILQPFPQLGRETHVLTDEERASERLARFEGITVPVHTVLGLVRRGWERGMPLDAGIERWISKPVPGGLHVVIDLDGGISVGYIAESEDQTLNAVWINDRPDDFWAGGDLRHTFGELDPVTASEVLADLTWLAGSAL